MNKNMGTRTFASLFCGCGGFDLGFTQAGFRCIAAFDNDALAVEVHLRNLKSPAMVTDLSNGSMPLSTLSGLDVLLAGPPCQGFSTAGKRDFHDPRNSLLITAGHIALKVRPRVFIAENVTGVTSGPHRQYWDSLQQMLRDAGYQTANLLCEAVKMGVPQIRKRRILIAWSIAKDIDIKIPEVNGGVLRSALENIINAQNHNLKLLPLNSDAARIAKRIKPGQKLSDVREGDKAVHTWDIPEVFGETTEAEKTLLKTILRMRRRLRIRDTGDGDPVRADVLSREFGRTAIKLLTSLEKKGYVRRFGSTYDLARTFNGKYRRLKFDEPSLTVDTRFGEPRYFLHPTELRGFTVREAARIQGFPDTFIFHGPEKAQYRLVGNAVPPTLALQLARFIKYALLA